MPVLPSTAVEGIDNSPYRVLLTGFGPFSRYPVNPSWLAVQPLHNVILQADGSANPFTYDDQLVMAIDSDEPQSRRIHITAVMIPVEYEAVLAIVPSFQARPPVLPESHDPASPTIPPPSNGYDFIFHVGVAGRGPLRMEKLGHKLGYRMKDAAGKLAPVVPDENLLDSAAREIMEAERRERDKLAVASIEISKDTTEPPMRGFGKGYEIFDDEIYTDIDVERLVAHLKETGIDQIYSSMDAGHYLCDFIYYCSLAESRRMLARTERHLHGHEKGKSVPILFLHCPPVEQPLSTEEVTEAIRKIILWVCRGI